MRYRQLTVTGDYSVSPNANWLVNSPACVAQAILTRLNLLAGQWFLDITEGLDTTKILGVRTQSTRDIEVKQRILGTPGVQEILQYSSVVDSQRGFTVNAVVDTIYGQTTISEALAP